MIIITVLLDSSNEAFIDVSNMTAGTVMLINDKVTLLLLVLTRLTIAVYSITLVPTEIRLHPFVPFTFGLRSTSSDTS